MCFLIKRNRKDVCTITEKCLDTSSYNDGTDKTFTEANGYIVYRENKNETMVFSDVFSILSCTRQVPLFAVTVKRDMNS